MSLVTKHTSLPKSMMNVCILEIIADAGEHSPITQDRIRQQLETVYGIKADRKTVHRHLEDIAESVKGLRYAERLRGADAEAPTVMTDFWLEGSDEFDEAELRALVYTVAFAKHIPTSCKKDLVRKLEALSASRTKVKLGSFIAEDSNTTDDYNQLFWNLELLSSAIEQKRKVSFKYAQMGADKKAHLPDCRFTVSPLGIGVRDDDFQLVAVLNEMESATPHEAIGHFRATCKAAEAGETFVRTFRIDRIWEAEITGESRGRLNMPKGTHLKGAHGGSFDLQEHLKENPTLQSGYSVQARFRFTEDETCGISDVVDFFSRANVEIEVDPYDASPPLRRYRISVRTNRTVMRDFALKHTANVEVLEPASLREELASLYRLALERLNGSRQPTQTRSL